MKPSKVIRGYMELQALKNLVKPIRGLFGVRHAESDLCMRVSCFEYVFVFVISDRDILGRLRLACSCA